MFAFAEETLSRPHVFNTWTADLTCWSTGQRSLFLCTQFAPTSYVHSCDLYVLVPQSIQFERGITRVFVQMLIIFGKSFILSKMSFLDASVPLRIVNRRINRFLQIYSGCKMHLYSAVFIAYVAAIF